MDSIRSLPVTDSIYSAKSSETIEQKLASTAFEEMKNAPSATDQTSIGLSYAKEIIKNTKDEMTRVIAKSTLKVHSTLGDTKSGIHVLYNCFKAIAKGVHGPIGQVLAGLGFKSMSEATNVWDQHRVGNYYLKSVEKNTSSDVEKSIANTALKANEAVYKDTSSAQVLFAANYAIASGIQGPVGTVLAQVGLDTINRIDPSTMLDRSQIGRTFVESIRDNTTDETQKAQAESTLRAFEASQDAYDSKNILGNFLREQAG